MQGPGSAGDIWIATMHSSSANTLTAVHTAWTTFVNNLFSGTLNALNTPDTQCTGTVTDALDPATGRNTQQASSTITQVGSGAGAAPSPRSCLVFSWVTALHTRAGRGRMFLPSPDASHYTATGDFVSAMCTSVSAAAAALLVTFSATAIPVIYHRTTRTTDNITDLKIGNIVGTQRRRTNKVLNTYADNPI
jgi:hypothetical protein